MLSKLLLPGRPLSTDEVEADDAAVDLAVLDDWDSDEPSLTRDLLD